MFSMRLIIGIIFSLLINVKYSLANHKFTCNHFTEKYEKKFSLPNKLLTSISLVESGKKVGDKFTSWPWTLNVEGKSKFFESKDQTLSFLKLNSREPFGPLTFTMESSKETFTPSGIIMGL